MHPHLDRVACGRPGEVGGLGARRRELEPDHLGARHHQRLGQHDLIVHDHAGRHEHDPPPRQRVEPRQQQPRQQHAQHRTDRTEHPLLRCEQQRCCDDRGGPNQPGHSDRWQEGCGRAEQEPLLVAVGRGLRAALTELRAADQQPGNQGTGDERCARCGCGSTDPADGRRTAGQRVHHADDREAERRRHDQRDDTDSPRQPADDGHHGTHGGRSTVERVADRPRTDDADREPGGPRPPRAGQRRDET